MDLAEAARPRVALQEAEGGHGARSSESVANAERARIGEATRDIVDGRFSSRTRGMPTCPWLRRERGARRRENLAIVRGGAGAESQSDRASVLQIVLAPRQGQRPKRSRPNQRFVVDGLDVGIRLSLSSIGLA